MKRSVSCALTVIAVTALSLPATAVGHGGNERPRLSEAKLLRLETALLGREHALEHAAERRLVRKARRRRAAAARAGHGSSRQARARAHARQRAARRRARR